MENTRGNVYDNPVTQERAVVLISGVDSAGELVRAELWVPPGARVAAPHVHPNQTERFEVVAGRLSVRRGDDQHTVGPGEVVEVERGQVHDWWTSGDEPARVLVEVRPALRFEEAIVTMWGWPPLAARTRPGLPGCCSCRC